uniref:Large ribosomal subunit protein uL4c n=1 Tax=Hemiselmis tepida TaxID=464990 RepID=A0A7S0W8A5_9CRYP|mmetsp:Transcript_5433/g.13919  ORF Transcript_5433/g.13919 Transcript_5433/m.13919 type:complete len:216 (+) Transcript_5433:655-1302(+)
MAAIETINYKVNSLDKDSSSEKSVSLELKVTPNNSKYILHRAVVKQDSQSRQGTSSTKTRSEVRAGGKKPWKQKGTGQARSGSKNSPLWNGGGVAFGPKPRSYKKKINNKEFKLALQTALYSCNSKIVVVENFTDEVQKPNTKSVLQKLENVVDLKTKTLLVIKEPNKNISLSVRNVDKVNLLYSNTLNVKDLLMATKIIITEDALENIQKTYHE